MNGFGLYVHIPFCKKKCNYCDFLSFPDSDETLINQYVDSLTRPARSGTQTVLAASSEFFFTIFIGGGTPTLLSENQLEIIIISIFEYFKIEKDAEFTIEANPGTADFNKLKLLKDKGVNRLSIGAQLFNNKELETLGRIHSSNEIYKSFEAAHKAGFSNINLDLIFAIPGQSLESWECTLKEAVKLNPTHISAYNLQLEEGTFFYKNKESFDFLDDEAELEMYKLTIEFLKANGYNHYEISNFAKPGFECNHNINYWKNGNYLGIGLGASSHIDGKRWQNTSDMNEYINNSHKNQSIVNESVNIENEISETIFMGLRLIKGINLQEFETRFGISLLKKYQKEAEELLNFGLVEIDGNNIRLSEKGLYLGNEVFARFV